MEKNSIFTRILNGDLPGEVIFEDEKCFVILTIDPFSEGHCLVIPREEVDSLWDVEAENYEHLMLVAREMAIKLRGIYDYKRIGMLVEGFGVSHAHVHIFGMNENMNELIPKHLSQRRQIEHSEMKFVADKLRNA